MAELKLINPKDYVNVTRIRTLQDADEFLIPWLTKTQTFGWDIETTIEKQVFNRKIRTCQFGDKHQQFLIDLLDFVDSPAQLAEYQGYFGEKLPIGPLSVLLVKLKPFLCSGKYLKVGVNLGFEYQNFYWCFGMRPFGFYDCEIVERVIVAGAWPMDDFTYFSMEEMMERYYGVQIDKTLQQSFTLDQPLTQEQIEYAVLDTRFPLAIRARQTNGYTKESGVPVPGLIEDGLLTTAEIENACIMSFQDMYVNGENIDRPRWSKHVETAMAEYKKAIEKLDALFIPKVGTIHQVVSEEDVLQAKTVWKELRDNKAFGTKHPQVIKLKEHAMNKQKQRTQQKRVLKVLSEKHCPWQAMFNYDSPGPLLEILQTQFALPQLESTDDGELKNFEGVPVIDALRDFREYGKKISTYSWAWVQEWKTEPSNEEGWLSPYTHKLHPRYNQLMAETGRSSSDKPNGQNLPRDPEVRRCFIADPGMVYVTIDMSGAELRIIAELANAKTWIDAFARGEDLHSVGCEILFPKEWPAEAEPGCAYYALNDQGVPAHQKCKCKSHKHRREITKAINFFLAYGGVASTLADRIGITLEEAEAIMAEHEKQFPDIWEYLEKSGKQAQATMQARDMYGRRRRFRQPTPELGRQRIIDYWADSIALREDIAEQNVINWQEAAGTTKNPPKEIKFWLEHREPTPKEIARSMSSMMRGIERQGKNHCIQATNATIIKKAMGAGYSPKGRPYLFHTLPLLQAKLVGMVHDELKIMCPKENAERVAKMVGIAFKTAAAEVMHKVIMEFEYKIAPYWDK